MEAGIVCSPRLAQSMAPPWRSQSQWSGQTHWVPAADKNNVTVQITSKARQLDCWMFSMAHIFARNTPRAKLIFSAKDVHSSVLHKSLCSLLRMRWVLDRRRGARHGRNGTWDIYDVINIRDINIASDASILIFWLTHLNSPDMRAALARWDHHVNFRFSSLLHTLFPPSSAKPPSAYVLRDAAAAALTEGCSNTRGLLPLLLNQGLSRILARKFVTCKCGRCPWVCLSVLQPRLYWGALWKSVPEPLRPELVLLRTRASTREKEAVYV